MDIQSSYSASAYQGSGKVGLQMLAGNATKAVSVASTTSANSTSSTDQVTISAAALELAAKESSATQARTPAQDALLKSLASDPQGAEKFASDIANTPSTIFYDISGTSGGDPVNKLSSGRIIDDSFKAKFASEASTIDAQRKAIYNSEKAKETDPVQILSKMIDFTNSQSRDYLEAIAQLG